MIQQAAHLDWYDAPPDYMSAPKPTAAGPMSGVPEHVGKDGPTHDTAPGNFTFDDFLDIINPLHHLPVIGSLYRAATGDEISAHARILGGGLFGGGSGFVAAIANAISEETSGRDIGSNLVAAVFEDDPTPEADNLAQALSPKQVAEADPFFAPPGRSPAAPAGSDDLASLAGRAGAEAGATAAVQAEARSIAQAAAVPAPASAPRMPEAFPETEERGPGSGDDRRMLTGAEALQALAADLQGSRRPLPAAAPAAEGAAMTARPVPSRHGRDASIVGPRIAGRTPIDPALLLAAQPSAGNAEGPEPAFANRMMQGLRKYEALFSARHAGTASPATSASSL